MTSRVSLTISNIAKFVSWISLSCGRAQLAALAQLDERLKGSSSTEMGNG
jgi:hypothetical protein